MLRSFSRLGYESWIEEDETRLEDLQVAKIRGKGAPKKIRNADEGKKHKKKGGKR